MILQTMDSYKNLAHDFAFDSEKNKVLPTSAEYNVDYFDNRGNKLILKAKDSKYKRVHFSYNPDVDWLNRTESNTVHTQAIEYIQKKGFVIVKGVKFEPAKIVIEKATLEGNRLIPDLTFYDSDGNILCLIEVYCTHKCEDEKIEIIKKLNILTLGLEFDEDYKKHTRHRSFGYRPSNEALSRVEQRIHTIEGDIDTIEGEILRIRGILAFRPHDTSKDIEIVEDQIRHYKKQQSDREDDEIREVESEIKHYTSEIQKTEQEAWQLRKEIPRLTRESQDIKDEVEKHRPSISGSLSEIKKLQRQFVEIAKTKDVIDYANSWIDTDNLSEPEKQKLIKYYCE